jgi:hypothetical protein
MSLNGLGTLYLACYQWHNLKVPPKDFVDKVNIDSPNNLREGIPHIVVVNHIMFLPELYETVLGWPSHDLCDYLLQHQLGAFPEVGSQTLIIPTQVEGDSKSIKPRHSICMLRYLHRKHGPFFVPCKSITKASKYVNYVIKFVDAAKPIHI